MQEFTSRFEGDNPTILHGQAMTVIFEADSLDDARNICTQLEKILKLNNVALFVPEREVHGWVKGDIKDSIRDYGNAGYTPTNAELDLFMDWLEGNMDVSLGMNWEQIANYWDYSYPHERHPERPEVIGPALGHNEIILLYGSSSEANDFYDVRNAVANRDDVWEDPRVGTLHLTIK